MELKPSEILYSQDSISNRFDVNSLHSGYLIGDTLDDICEGRCSIYDIPTIRVVEKNGKWVTCDNRRLWVFRHLERLGKVVEVPVRITSYIPMAKLTSENGGREITVRRRPGGYWHSKPSKRREPPKPKPISTNRRIYGFESPVPRPSTNVLDNITNVQQLDWAARRESSGKPVFNKPSPSATPQYGYSTGAFQQRSPASSDNNSIRSIPRPAPQVDRSSPCNLSDITIEKGTGGQTRHNDTIIYIEDHNNTTRQVQNKPRVAERRDPHVVHYSYLEEEDANSCCVIL